MFERRHLWTWSGIVLLSAMFLMGQQGWDPSQSECPSLVTGSGPNERPYFMTGQNCQGGDETVSGTVSFLNGSTLKIEPIIAGMPYLGPRYVPYSTHCDDGELRCFVNYDACWEVDMPPPGVGQICVETVEAYADDTDEDGEVDEFYGWMGVWACVWDENSGDPEPLYCVLDCVGLNAAYFFATHH
jgi:hypothetical protein